jgi:argininosuccinate lyase
VRILDGCISSLKFNLEKMERSSGAGFSTATELADSLVRVTGMPFRTAHSIVGRVAALGRRPDMGGLDTIAQEIAGFRASERGFSAEDLERALDPKSNVRLRANTGGPAPSETLRMVEVRRKMLSQHSQLVAEWKYKATRALLELRDIE